MNVSACLVTRGDVDMQPVLDSLPAEWEKIVWDNSYGYVKIQPPMGGQWNTWRHVGRGNPPADLSVYGRYAAIEYASHDLIYVQDDDVIVSDPQAIVRALVTRECPDCGLLDHQAMTDGSWICHSCGCVEALPDAVVCNMPPEFRHEGYTDSCLVGFGACFHRDLPAKAFARYRHIQEAFEWDDVPDFRRTCDVVFTTMTPRVLVDVPKQNREFAEGPDRMYRQPDHVGERARMLELARAVRDA